MLIKFAIVDSRFLGGSIRRPVDEAIFSMLMITIAVTSRREGTRRFAEIFVYQAPIHRRSDLGKGDESNCRLNDLKSTATYIPIDSAALLSLPVVTDSTRIPARVCNVIKTLCDAQTLMLMSVVHNYRMKQYHRSKQKTKKIADC